MSNYTYVIYKSEAGFEVPALLVSAYDSNGNVATEDENIASGDILVLGTSSGSNTSLTGISMGTSNGEFALEPSFSEEDNVSHQSIEERLDAIDVKITSTAEAITPSSFVDGEQPAISLITEQATGGQTFWGYGWGPSPAPTQYTISNYGSPSWGPTRNSNYAMTLPEVGRYLLSGWCSMSGSGHTVNSARPIGLEFVGAGGGNDYAEHHLTMVWQSAAATTYASISWVLDVTALPTGTGPYAVTAGNPQGFQITSHNIAFSAGDIFTMYLMIYKIG